MAAKTRSEPVLLLVDFIKSTKIGDEYSFECEAGRGENILHRMRVELSRLRSKAIQQGHQPKHFKVIHVKTEELPEGKEKVTIKRTRSENNVSDEVFELIQEISLPKHAMNGGN